MQAVALCADSQEHEAHDDEVDERGDDRRGQVHPSEQAQKRWLVDADATSPKQIGGMRPRTCSRPEFRSTICVRRQVGRLNSRAESLFDWAAANDEHAHLHGSAGLTFIAEQGAAFGDAKALLVELAFAPLD